MAEALRNEVAIDLAGQERTMRATFTAIRAIERDTGRSMMELQARGTMSVTDMARIVYHGLRGAGDESLTLDQVGDAILERGYGSDAVFEPVISFLNRALEGVSVGKSESPPAK